MLKQLFITSMLSMGVANVTPILDNNKKPLENQTITNNYDFTCNPYNVSFIENQNETINNNQYSQYSTGTIQDKKSQVYASTNYINVKGNIYSTYVYNKAGQSTNLKPITHWANKYYYDQYNTTYTPTTTMMYVLQLTPYNYNENTTAYLDIYIEMQNLILGQYEIDITDIHMLRKVYITTEQTWANYLDMNLTKNIVKNIENDIENPNSNYYYSLNTNVFNCYYDVTENEEIVDRLEFEITPKITNYMVIEYTPLVSADFEELGEITQNTYGNVMTMDAIWDYTGIRFTGTNIIPDSTYEVIDIPGLMWEILTMPFAFISQAFNLTLFPGTPYQLNISNLFLSIIAIFVFIGIISMFLKMKG